MFFLEFPWVCQVKCVQRSDLNLGLEVWLVEQFENIRLSYKLYVIHQILPWFVIIPGLLTIKLVDIVLLVACPNIKDGHNAWVPSQKIWGVLTMFILYCWENRGLIRTNGRESKQTPREQPVVMDVNIETGRKLIWDPTGYLYIVYSWNNITSFFFRENGIFIKWIKSFASFQIYRTLHCGCNSLQRG